MSKIEQRIDRYKEYGEVVDHIADYRGIAKRLIAEDNELRALVGALASAHDAMRGISPTSLKEGKVTEKEMLDGFYVMVIIVDKYRKNYLK
jgi:hypothetical protein